MNTETKTIELNTNICPLLNLGFYESAIDFCEFFINDIEELEKNNPELLEKINYNFMYKEWEQYCFKIGMQHIESMLISLDNLGIVKVNPIQLWSPKEYNFATDTGDFTIEVSKNFNINLVNELKKLDQTKFNEYLKDNFSSYDGFWSHTANNIEDFYSEILEGHEQEIGVGLAYLYFDINQTDENEYYYSSFMDDICGNTSFNEYIPEEFYDEYRATIERIDA